MPTFVRKSAKIEPFEDLFRTRLKIHNQLTQDDRINYFHSLMRGDALQTFENINGPTREILGEIPAVFRRKYVKPQSMATAKYQFQNFVFNRANQKLVDFLDELQKLAKDAFGKAVRAVTEHFIHAKMPPYLKKSINQVHLENGTYEQIVTELEKELELNGLEAPDELQRNTVSQQLTNANADRRKPTCHQCEKLRRFRNQCRLLKTQRGQLKTIKLILETETMTPITLSQTTTPTISTTKTVTELKGSQKLFIHSVRHVARRTTPQRDVILEPMQQTGHFPGRAKLNNRTQRTV